MAAQPWRNVNVAHPAAVFDAPVQRLGAYPTVWQMMDHIFLVERRVSSPFAAGPTS